MPSKDMPSEFLGISMWHDAGADPKIAAIGQAHNSRLVALKCGSVILSFPK